MAKKIKSSLKDHPYTQLVNQLKQYGQLTPFLDQLQNFSLTVEKKLSIEDCLNDLHANFDMLNTRLFFGMQVERLFATETLSEKMNVDSMFKKYHDIIAQDITVSALSRQKLDPHCKSEYDFSSAISHYKKWLVQFLFILFLTKPVEKFHYQSEDLTLYLLFIHQIQLGQTISKVTLRTAAKIDSSAILELPRNTDIRLHQHLSNTQWAYISLADNDVQGFVPLAYIKTIT